MWWASQTKAIFQDFGVGVVCLRGGEGGVALGVLGGFGGFFCQILTFSMETH